MNTFLNILKEHQVGKWCKLAAWLAAAFGLINILIGIYTTAEQYNTASQFGQSFSNSLLFQDIRLVVSLIPPYIFYFFILYAAGVVVNHFTENMDDDAIDEDELEEENDLALDEEDGEPIIVPGQME